MRIAISGAQSVGKTTLLNKLKEEALGYSFKGEITRDLKTRGFLINEQGNDATQLEIMKMHIEYLENKNTIFDRCLLDGIVYTHYLYENSQVTTPVFNKALELFKNNINSYDIIFYIIPEFEIEHDGERSSDVDFRDRIVQLFEYYIKKFEIGVYFLTGSIEERVNQFKEKLQ